MVMLCFRFFVLAAFFVPVGLMICCGCSVYLCSEVACP